MNEELDKLIQLWPENARKQRRLEPGQFLFRQGQQASSIYGLLDGRLRLVRDLQDGSRVSLHTARKGETFAEASVGATHYHCHAIADQASVVEVLDSRVLNSRNPPKALLQALNSILAQQVRESRTQLSLRDIRSADERVLAWLQLRSDIEGLIHLDESWTQIAEQIGLTRESVYRALAKLAAGKIIERLASREQGGCESIRLL